MGQAHFLGGKMPRILDLCCKAGGASWGYHLAGWEVVGVDIELQPDYPFPFIQGNALDIDLTGFDAYHASPPCQRFSPLLALHPQYRENHLDLIDPIRTRLQATGKPYIIENVPAAPLENALFLCGTMFGLRTIKHRKFESNVLLFQPHHHKHKLKAAKLKKPQDDEYWSSYGFFGYKQEAQEALGINWMKTCPEIANAIPPAYTEYLGKQLLEYIS